MSIHDNRLDLFFYQSGLVAQGCIENLDEYTMEAIYRFGRLIVKDCALTAGLMEHEGRRGVGAQILDNYGIEND